MGEEKVIPEHKSVEPGPIEFSNGIRLTWREWIGVGLYTLVLVAFAPSLWQQIEVFSPGADYRLPHDLGNDYWLYQRNCRAAADRYDTLLIGDSVVWGEYVRPDQTLSHYLNEQAGCERFANLGLDGAHPLALLGLVNHYATAVTNKNVIIQCNPLWLSSPRADLQDEKQTDFNHPRLVPQFQPSIPCNRAEISTRLGVLVEQRVPFNSWTGHLQQAYYDRADLPGWTLEHPYDNPLQPLNRELSSVENSVRHLPQSWQKNGISRQDYPWVDLADSLQWRAFRDVVGILQERGNRVLVLLGPFNEHMLEPGSLQRYQHIKSQIQAWLTEKQVVLLAPPALPSDLYGDASHPLAEGYAILARQLLSTEFHDSR